MAAMNPRLESLDALRGLNTALIIGLSTALWGIYTACPTPFWEDVRYQMGHAPWEGLRVYDIIFPLFVYLSGISLNFSVRKRGSSGTGNAKLLLHMWYRAIVLVLLGILVNGPLLWDIADMRCASVLGLIGISGAMAGTLVLILRKTWLIGLGAALILLAVFLMQYLGGDMTAAGCINAKADALLCPGKLYYGVIDPEGPLCILSATALALGGYLSGRVFSTAYSAPRRVLTLLIGGGIAIVIGLLGPCIKNIWTPCFVLLCGGIGAVLMAVFHLIIDVCKLYHWAWPFKVIGTNALFIYLFTHVIAFGQLTERICGGSIREFVATPWHTFAYGMAYFLLAWLLCLLLYKQRIFVKV